MDQPSTGNARRESYAHIPMPRMTNTYMLNGEDHFEDMVSSVEEGIYAKNFDGGKVFMRKILMVDRLISPLENLFFQPMKLI